MLDQSDRKLLLTVARERILAHLQDREPQLPVATPGVRIESGAFVTLYLNNASGRRRLRGCIGQIEAHGALYDTIGSMAHSAAFCDSRFPSVGSDELAAIELEISVLSPLLRVPASEVHTGEGLFIRRQSKSGLLLPQVATGRNWDRETFLSQTCLKAGLSDRAWREEHTEIYTFTAEVFDEASVEL